MCAKLRTNKLLLLSGFSGAHSSVIYKDLATSTQRRNRFEIPLLAAILRTKFPKEQTLVHKTTNLCATQNNWSNIVTINHPRRSKQSCINRVHKFYNVASRSTPMVA